MILERGPRGWLRRGADSDLDQYRLKDNEMEMKGCDRNVFSHS